MIRFKSPQPHSAGFTLIELMIVVTIIGILTAIFVSSQSEARVKARNNTVISQVAEYVKALELYHSDTGQYPPTTANRRARFCIGDNSNLGGDCMGPITTDTSDDDSAANQALRVYLSALPRFSQPRGSYNYSSPAYSGCTDPNPAIPYGANSSCTKDDFSLYFLLEGTNQDCARSQVADPSLSGEYTLCRYQGRAVN